MAVLSAQNPTLLDLAKATDPDGSIADIIEIMTETNEILQDIVFLQGNLTTGMRTSVRAGLPTPTWRRLYGGVQPDRGELVQIDEGCGMLEAYAEVDKALADLSDDVRAFRLQEEVAHIESMAQELANTIFYGSEITNPASFTGLSPRYNDLSADNGENIIDAGGTGTDNASIWLVVWGNRTVHGIVPKNSIAGMQRTDKGQVTLEDASDGSNTGRMEAYRTHFRQDSGLCVRDWRFAVRIANIDKSDLTSDMSTGADLADLIHRAITQVPSLNTGRSALYMSRTVMGYLRRQVSAGVSQSTLTMANVGGTLQTSFMEIPLRRCDALAADEARVT